MNLIEKHRLGKTGHNEICEDFYCITDDYACVIDGATNVSGNLIDGESPGQFASRIIGNVINTLAPGMDIDDIMQTINDELIHHYHQHGLYEHFVQHPHTRPSAAMVLYSKTHHKIWMVSDCQCIIDEKLYENKKEIDDITANARSLFIEAELQSGKTLSQLLERDTGFDYILPLLQRQYYLQNKIGENQYGYDVINGFPLDISRIKTIDVPTDAKHIVLASDGYPELKGTLKESEDALDQLMQNDPLCIRDYKSAKGLIKGNVSFDDRTYLKIKLN